MNSNISGIHRKDCRFSERPSTVPRFHASCCHRTYETLRVPLPVAAMSFNEPDEPLSPHFPTCTITYELPKSCQVFYHPRRKKELNITITTKYNMYLRQQKMFKYISECIFHRTQLMAMHNTVITSNTNSIPPSDTHMQNSFTQCRNTNCQPIQILR